MSRSRRFTKEFETEAVQLVQTSGRTQREVAADLGIGLSTLVRWWGCLWGPHCHSAPSNSRLADTSTVCPSKMARTTEAARTSPLCSKPDRGGDLVDGCGQAACLRISGNQSQLRKCAHILMHAFNVTA